MWIIFQGLQLVKVYLNMDAILGRRIFSPMQHGAQDKRCESKEEYIKIYVPKKQWAS